MNKYLYVIKTIEEDDTQKLYEIFLDYSKEITIGENDKSLILEVIVKDKISDIYKVIGDIPTEYVTIYNLIEDWMEFNGSEISKSERQILYNKLKELKPKKNKSKLPILVGMLLAIVFLLCSLVIKISIFKYFSLVSVLTGVLVTFLSGLSKYTNEDLKEISNEEWIVCNCYVSSVDKIIHRPDKKTSWKEEVFRLAQNDKCFDYLFTGQELKVGERAKLFIRKNLYTNPFEETKEFKDDEQVYSFNGVFVVIPDSYKIKKKKKKKKKKINKKTSKKNTTNKKEIIKEKIKEEPIQLETLAQEVKLDDLPDKDKQEIVLEDLEN